jgi:hypothetical protein
LVVIIEQHKKALLVRAFLYLKVRAVAGEYQGAMA